METFELCKDCKVATEGPYRRVPIHLGHPTGGELMLFDVYGQATCPSCGAMWRRIYNEIMLVFPSPRRGPKRALVADGAVTPRRRTG